MNHDRHKMFWVSLYQNRRGTFCFKIMSHVLGFHIQTNKNGKWWKYFRVSIKLSYNYKSGNEKTVHFTNICKFPIPHPYNSSKSSMLTHLKDNMTSQLILTFTSNTNGQQMIKGTQHHQKIHIGNLLEIGSCYDRNNYTRRKNYIIKRSLARICE